MATTPMDSYSLPSAQTFVPSLRDRLVFLMRGSMTKRFHNGAVLHENTVAHHSWGVLWFCYLLSDGYMPSAELLLAAAAHDMAEQVTGDMPAPAKRMLGIRPLLQEKENQVLGTFGLEFENLLSARELKMLGLADCMDGMLFCIRERMFGNRFIEFTFEKFHGYIRNEVETLADKKVLAALIQMWEDAIGGNYNES